MCTGTIPLGRPHKRANGWPAGERAGKANRPKADIITWSVETVVRAGNQTKATRPRRAPAGDRERVLIWGIHAVEAALRHADRQILHLWLTENAERRLSDSVAARGLPADRVVPRDLDRRLGADTVHQGALLEAEPLPPSPVSAMAQAASSRRPIVVLDQVTDPHNVGAVLRSAGVFGASGLIMTRRHSPPLAGALAKAASGALELVPIAVVQNLGRTLVELKDAGVRIVGLDGAASAVLEDVLFDANIANRSIALVLGAEGKGLRQSIEGQCDVVCRIDGDGPIRSLNVSNAAAVCLHLAAMARRARDG